MVYNESVVDLHSINDGIKSQYGISAIVRFDAILGQE